MTPDSIKGPQGNEPPQKLPETTPATPGENAPTYGAQQPIDPAGIWARFLSMQSGEPADPEEVKLFIQSFQRVLQVLVQQNDRAFQRAMEERKKAQQGDWS